MAKRSSLHDLPGDTPVTVSQCKEHTRSIKNYFLVVLTVLVGLMTIIVACVTFTMMGMSDIHQLERSLPPSFPPPETNERLDHIIESVDKVDEAVKKVDNTVSANSLQITRLEVNVANIEDKLNSNHP